MKLLGIKDTSSKLIINPFNLPGLHYFCKQCESDVSYKLEIQFPDERRVIKDSPNVSTDAEGSPSEITPEISPIQPESMLAPELVLVHNQLLQDVSSDIIHSSQIASSSTSQPDFAPSSPSSSGHVVTTDNTILLGIGNLNHNFQHQNTVVRENYPQNLMETHQKRKMKVQQTQI